MFPHEERGERLSEEMLDHAIIDAVRNSAAFWRGLARRVGVADCGEWRALREATRSVVHGTGADHGQTDVWLRAEDGPGREVILLAESKVNAAFMPRQGERYKNRARELARESSRKVLTILFAPNRYLAAANPEFLFFDERIALEEALGWFTEEEQPQLHAAAVLKALIARANDGRPLGAKGLFPEVHYPLAAELRRRNSSLRITNHPTDWVFLTDSRLVPQDAKLRYRIRESRAEVRLRGLNNSSSLPVVAIEAPTRFERNGSEACYFRHVAVSPEARVGAPSHDDIVRIADELETLAAWWRDRPRT